MDYQAEAYLCDLCSEIYRYEKELREHMLEDHQTPYVSVTEVDEDKNGIETEEKNPLIEEFLVGDSQFKAPRNEEPIGIEQETGDNPANTDQLIVPDDLNSMMEVTDEIDFRPFTSGGDPGPSSEFCMEVLVDVSPEAPVDSQVLFPPPKKKIKKPRKPRVIHCCEFCPYTTKIKSCMSTHRLTHTLDCPFCPFKTIRSEKLTEHMANKHFNNNNQLQLQRRPNRPRNYMKEEFILASNPANNQNQSQEGGGVGGVGGSGGAGFQYLRPGVIITSKDVEKVAAAQEYLNNRGLGGVH